MAKCQSSMRSEDGKPQIKYKGIHEPKGRVKGYRVEIRPPNSAQKIWVGTFDTRPKAMRAFDAAVYLTGKEPHYYIYPEDYFPTRLNKPSREFVQTEAKKLADRTDDLKVNPSSFLVDPSIAGSVEASSGLIPGIGNEPITLNTSNVKAVEKINTPVLPDYLKPFARFLEVEEFLQNADVPRAPAELIPALEADSLWSWDLLVEEAKLDVGEAKADVEEAKKELTAGVWENEVSVKEAENAAFDRGYNDPDFDALQELLDREPPESFLPLIEGEFFTPVFSASRPSSKRKRDANEGANIVRDHRKSGELSESGATDVDDWWPNVDDFVFNDPMKQPFYWLGTDETPLW